MSYALRLILNRQCASAGSARAMAYGPWDTGHGQWPTGHGSWPVAHGAWVYPVGSIGLRSKMERNRAERVENVGLHSKMGNRYGAFIIIDIPFRSIQRPLIGGAGIGGIHCATQ